MERQLKSENRSSCTSCRTTPSSDDSHCRLSLFVVYLSSLVGDAVSRFHVPNMEKNYAFVASHQSRLASRPAVFRTKSTPRSRTEDLDSQSAPFRSISFMVVLCSRNHEASRSGSWWLTSLFLASLALPWTHESNGVTVIAIAMTFRRTPYDADLVRQATHHHLARVSCVMVVGQGKKGGNKERITASTRRD